MLRHRDRRTELAALRAELAGTGMPVDRIATLLRKHFRCNSLAAWRHAHGLTQQQVADRWNQLWPSDRPLTYKQIGYWEAWPARSGRPPSIEGLSRLARIYRCRTADLLDEPDSATGPNTTDAPHQDISKPVSTALSDPGSAVSIGSGLTAQAEPPPRTICMDDNRMLPMPKVSPGKSV